MAVTEEPLDLLAWSQPMFGEFISSHRHCSSRLLWIFHSSLLGFAPSLKLSLNPNRHSHSRLSFSEGDNAAQWTRYYVRLHIHWPLQSLRNSLLCVKCSAPFALLMTNGSKGIFF